MIRKGTLSDIDSILIITKACAKKMVDDDIYQWNDHYPNSTAFENDVKRNELYVLEINNIIVGCVAISVLMDKEYEDVKWLTKNENNIYIHRLAIHPVYQGQGSAQQLMDYAEQFAIENNYISIRLDTFSHKTKETNYFTNFVAIKN